MTKYIYLFYILLGVCLLAGFGSAFDSGPGARCGSYSWFGKQCGGVV